MHLGYFGNKRVVDSENGDLEPRFVALLPQHQMRTVKTGLEQRSLRSLRALQAGRPYATQVWLAVCEAFYEAKKKVGNCLPAFLCVNSYFDTICVHHLKNAYTYSKVRAVKLTDKLEFVGLMLLHIFNEIFCFRPIFDAPIFKIPFIDVWIAFIIDIKNSPIRNHEICRKEIYI